MVGFLNNGAASTVVIGAHYDYLGHGEDGNTLYQGKDTSPTTAPSDNASGIAGDDRTGADAGRLKAKGQ